MSNKDNNEIFDSLSAPLGDIISSVARGVADAQQALDMRTIETFKEIYGKDDGLKEEMRQLGYQPTWYKIPEVNAEIIMSLSISENSETNISQIASPDKVNKPNALKLYGAPVDANYANRYNYDIKAACKVSFKIVPVPPAAKAEEMKIVPFLNEKPLDEAEQLLNMLGIPYKISVDENEDFAANNDEDNPVTETNFGTEEKVSIEPTITKVKVLSTYPEPGVILKLGQTLILTINNNTNE